MLHQERANQGKDSRSKEDPGLGGPPVLSLLPTLKAGWEVISPAAHSTLLMLRQVTFRAVAANAIRQMSPRQGTPVPLKVYIF